MWDDPDRLRVADEEVGELGAVRFLATARTSALLRRFRRWRPARRRPGRFALRFRGELEGAALRFGPELPSACLASPSTTSCKEARRTRFSLDRRHPRDRRWPWWVWRCLTLAGTGRLTSRGSKKSADGRRARDPRRGRLRVLPAAPDAVSRAGRSASGAVDPTSEDEIEISPPGSPTVPDRKASRIDAAGRRKKSPLSSRHRSTFSGKRPTT